MKRALIALAFVSLLLDVSAAQAESVSLVAHLLGSSEVPATQSDAFAEAQFTYDNSSRALEYYVNYDGVTPAKVDLHGPAAANEKASVVLNISLSESPISGTIQLTPEQGRQLLAGKMYLDIHSQKYPDGEIRGQIIRQ
jgi:hypothetical protein